MLILIVFVMTPMLRFPFFNTSLLWLYSFYFVLTTTTYAFTIICQVILRRTAALPRLKPSTILLVPRETILVIVRWATIRILIWLVGGTVVLMSLVSGASMVSLIVFVNSLMLLLRLWLLYLFVVSWLVIQNVLIQVWEVMTCRKLPDS